MVKDYPPPLPPKKEKKRVLDHYLHHDLGYATTVIVFIFAHLLILEYPDHHQNVISSSLYYPGTHPKISSQSVHNSLSNIVHKQTNRQTSAIKNITSFAKEVMREVRVKKRKQSVCYLLIMHPGLKIHNVSQLTSFEV